MRPKQRNKPHAAGEAPTTVSEASPLYGETYSSSFSKPAAWIVASFGASHKGGSTIPSPTKLIKIVREGLPIEELDALQGLLGVPIEELAPILGISKATLHRRRTGETLTQSESDRVVRFAKLMGRAVQVLESPESARRWLKTPQLGLGGELPLEYAQTEVGAREVEDLLGRIEFGVYS